MLNADPKCPVYTGKDVLKACTREFQEIFQKKILEKRKELVPLQKLSLYTLEGWDSLIPVSELTFAISVPLKYADDLGLTNIDDGPKIVKVIEGKTFTLLTDIFHLHATAQYRMANT